MPDTNHTSGGRRGVRTASRFLRLLLLGIFALSLAGCSGLAAAGLGPEKVEDPSVALQKIAAGYVQSGDLAAAQAAIGELSLANPTQLLATLADEAIAQGRPEQDALARLAGAMGAKSPRLQAYLQPTVAASATPFPPTVAPPPSATTAPTDTVAPTAVPATAAPEPTTLLTATAIPVAPRVVAETDVNLRGGPGKQYPMVGQLRRGQEVDIIGRNASGDWWQLDWDGQAWVAGTVVKVQGPIDTVAVAKNIPAPPVRPTQPPAAPAPAAPAPTAAPAAPAPNPGVQYIVKSLRLRPLGTGAQRCDGGDHNIFVTVVDAAGNRLDGVRVREIFSDSIKPTGSQGKGAGNSEWDIYRGGGGQLEIVDDAGNRISEQTRGMSDDWPPFDLMRDAGYCTCKPHLDDASCQSDLENKAYLFAVGHYVYEVVFQRTY